jgi:hypothetical protein
VDIAVFRFLQIKMNRGTAVPSLISGNVLAKVNGFCTAFCFDDTSKLS